MLGDYHDAPCMDCLLGHTYGEKMDINQDELSNHSLGSLVKKY